MTNKHINLFLIFTVLFNFSNFFVTNDTKKPNTGGMVCQYMTYAPVIQKSEIMPNLNIISTIENIIDPGIDSLNLWEGMGDLVHVAHPIGACCQAIAQEHNTHCVQRRWPLPVYNIAVKDT